MIPGVQFISANTTVEAAVREIPYEEAVKAKIYMRDMDLMIADMEKELVDKQINPGLCYRKGYEDSNPSTANRIATQPDD